MSSEKKTYLNLTGIPGNNLSGKEFNSPVIPLFNGHIHTPYSFSSFLNIEQAFRMAKEEGIKALGINDFYTTDGYSEFAEMALRFRIFPLFNIEFMGLMKEEQQAGIRVNDPVNPGRTYLSGKGLNFPVKMSTDSRNKLEKLQRESNRQTCEMVEKLNHFLAALNTDIHLEADEIKQKLAKNLLRERHIASAFRIAASEKFGSEEELRNFYNIAFQGKELKSSLSHIASLENEIRNNLLKAGGPAFVPEDENAFLTLKEVITLIIDAGGIPCYPVLLDDPKGNFTEFEKDWPQMAGRLGEMKISMLELIPGRNDPNILKEFVRYFHRRGFVITFGTEHNTPQLDPLTVATRGGIPLDEELLAINYQGISVIAAHQYLTAMGSSGFPTDRKPSEGEINDLEQLGKNTISQFTQS